MECKGSISLDGIEPVSVLIETLWNVKTHSRRSLRTAVGINRNIMECKGTDRAYTPVGYGVLIETLWNVKFGLFKVNLIADARINRNIMECKDWLKSAFMPAIRVY